MPAFFVLLTNFIKPIYRLLQVYAEPCAELASVFISAHSYVRKEDHNAANKNQF